MQKMKRPHPLKPGDRAAIVAPSSPVSENVLIRAIESLRFLGLEPVIFPSAKSQHGYLAGKDKLRAADLMAAFCDPAIKGVFCLRGGYGAMRILPLLDYTVIAKNPKVFVGYSDITALHVVFNQCCKFVTFHGPMPNTGYAKMDDYSLRSLENNLFLDKPLGVVENPQDELIYTICPGIAEGVITGGNLSLLQGTLSSPYEVNVQNKILFLEEVGERPYRVDKALTALALAGKFNEAAGIILGTFAECEEPDHEAAAEIDPLSNVSLSLKEIFDEVIKPFGKPTVLNFRAGHVYPQVTIPLGTRVRLDASKGVLEFK